MLQVKMVHPIVPIDKGFIPETKDEIVLICEKCPLPKCKTGDCKRFREERKKLRSEKNGKGNKEKN